MPQGRSTRAVCCVSILQVGISDLRSLPIGATYDVPPATKMENWIFGSCCWSELGRAQQSIAATITGPHCGILMKRTG